MLYNLLKNVFDLGVNMIDIYITKDGKLEQIDTPEVGSWINVSNPTAEEREILLQEFNLVPDFLEDALDEEESPRVEIENGQTLTLVNIPVKSDEENEFYITIPLAIIVSKQYIMTICLEEENFLDRFIKKHIKGFYTQFKTRFILHVLGAISNEYLRTLRVLDKLTDRYEKNLYDSVANKELLDMLKIEKSLVYFSTSLRNNQIVLDRLHKTETIKNYPEDEDLLEDVITDNKQAIEMCTIYANLMSSTMETYASIISNNQNDTMKSLTIITLIMSVPTIVGGLYGMNVLLPLRDHPHMFWILLLVMAVSSGLLIYILRRIKML